MTKVEKAILRTLAFFDIFKRPLTLEELWHFLYKIQASKLQVFFGLRNLKKNKIISEKNNFFCLAKSKGIIKDFEEKKALCRKRWRKVHWVIKFLKITPFVKNISVINSLAFGISHQDSDIDILVISRKNRLWLTRAFMVLILEVLGQNKNKWYQAEKFCLGFAFDEEKLNLDKLRLKPLAGGDIYFSFWLATLKPTIDRKIYKKFIEANNWIFESLPNWTASEIGGSSKKNFLEKILEGKFGDKLENFLANIQIKRIWADPDNLRSTASVIADNHMMKLHAYDKRVVYRTKWQEKLKELKIEG